MAHNSILVASIVGFLIVTAFSVSALTWLNALKQKNCDCARDARVNFITFVCYYLIVMGLIMSALMQSNFKTMVQIVGLINTAMVIAFVVIGFKYVNVLREKKCACALDDPRRKVFEAWLWIYAIGYMLMVLFLVIALVLLAFTFFR